jgi:RNase adaptor protein for sRNA GlmZ degradation
VTLVIIGGPGTPDAVAAFVGAGFQRIASLDDVSENDVVLGVDHDAVELLRDADRRGINYWLVHDGDDDHVVGGTYDRAHHRIDTPRRRDELAEHLRSREKPLVTCMAFGYKSGAPADAALVFDARFLDNPYWVPELRPLTGRDPAVADYVLNQPEAGRFLDEVQRMVGDLVPLYEAKGMKHVVVAFGCSGGRHRSVALAAELARRLRESAGIDVDFVTRDID